MRIAAFILSFVVLSLSFLPCADTGNGTNDAKDKAALVHNSSQDSDEDHQDACSPFCYCTCCANVVYGNILINPTLIDLPDEKSFSSFLPTNLIEISLPVWQPPQLIA